jgi:SHS2 domain-containing protein
MKKETNMGTIEVFDHTADVGLRIIGDDLPDLFRTAAEGLFDYVVANREAVEVTLTEVVTLTSDSTANLLVGWLNELIFRSETQHILYSLFEPILSHDGLILEATIGGEAIDRDRHILDHEVKAVTHHGISLERDGAGWVAEVILDI